MNVAEARIRWRCRRGMRELELLLEEFLDRAWAGLTGSERAALERLLEYSDRQLQEYLFGGEEPAQREVAGIVAKIRRAVC